MADATAQENHIDGDPSALRTHSRYYDGIAAAVVTTVNNLRTVTDTLETTSDAVAAFADIAREVSTSLDEVDDRYRTLAAQLAYFAGEVERLQGESALVQSQARTADSERHSAIYARDNAYNEMLWADPQDPRAAELIEDYNRYRERVNELSGTVGNLDSQLEQLLDEWRAIADGCANAINEVISGSDLNDSWWDSFANWVETVLPDIETFLDILAIVLTVAAFLMVLTGVGAVLAPALFAIARGIQLLAKVIMVVKLVTTTVQVARGKKSPMAFLQMGVDFAVDKIGGKLIDGAADKLGGRLLAKYGDDLLAFANAKGATDFADNLTTIRADGFGDWVDQVFKPAVNNPATSAAFEGFMVQGGLKGEGIADAIGGVGDAVKYGLGTMAIGSDGMAGVDALSGMLDNFAGPKHALSGLALDGVNLVKTGVANVTGLDLSVGSHLFPDQPVITRPSFEAVVSGS